MAAHPLAYHFDKYPDLNSQGAASPRLRKFLLGRIDDVLTERDEAVGDVADIEWCGGYDGYERRGEAPYHEVRVRMCGEHHAAWSFSITSIDGVTHCTGSLAAA